MTRHRIPVSGAAGHIENHIATALADPGMAPDGLDNLTTGHRSAARWGSLGPGESVIAAQVTS